MAGWFELSKSSDNQFRFVLKAGNGETILTSELYTSKASAEKGIASVRSNSPQEERYEKKTASNGKFYFNLKAANHQIIGSSQMYATAQSRETGIASVKANGTSQMYATAQSRETGIASVKANGTSQTVKDNT
ncbi:hypothetical protein EALG_00625 [Escherichia coli TA144]|nr:YegP family protein [Escherichia coli]OSK26858.1 hypothetical protein EALG_00625 [Escherichia coli TA144]